MLPSFEVLGRVVYSYPLMAGLGIIAAFLAICRYGPLRGVTPGDFLVASLVAAIPALAGAHLVFGLSNAGTLASIVAGGDSLAAKLQGTASCFNGLVFYGGVLAALIAFALWVRRKHPLQATDYLDLLAVTIPLFHAIARVGCFLGGCCYGIPFTPGVTYIYNPIAYANGIPRFPVQLLETAGELVIFLFLQHSYARGEHRGKLVEVWLGGYATLRFFDEFLRGDFYRGFLGPFSTSQWISMVILGVLLARRLGFGPGTSRHKPEREARCSTGPGLS